MTLDDSHDLMPTDISDQIPPLYATEQVDDPLARLRWLTPDSTMTWYITEFDPDQRLCFGLVDGHERELGYFSLDEIAAIRGPLGLQVERDLYFEPTPLSKCP
jgi:hypothetical protein